MDLEKINTKVLIDELISRYDHAVISLIEDKAGGTHIRRWKGNYLACMAMCTILGSYILEAYKATLKLISKEEKK